KQQILEDLNQSLDIYDKYRSDLCKVAFCPGDTKKLIVFIDKFQCIKKEAEDANEEISKKNTTAAPRIKTCDSSGSQAVATLSTLRHACPRPLLIAWSLICIIMVLDRFFWINEGTLSIFSSNIMNAKLASELTAESLLVFIR
ncbi:unnamed protein product, partial [Didymodactylos carnosus]